MVAQDIIGTSSYEEARLVFGQLADHIALNLEQRIIVQVRAVRDGAIADELQASAKQST